jgi:hypothetical protein
MPQTTLTPSMSVVERFSKVSSGDFEHELERIWDGIQTVRASVVEAVRDEKMTPIEGVSILACTTGQLLGYQAFHGQPQPAELLPYLFAGQRQ